MKKTEKSRVHAKQRRTLEAKEIASITEQLPLPDEVKAKLDKASILKLAITFMRLKQCVGEDQNVKWTGLVNGGQESRLLLESLGGFFLIVSTDMEVLYVSENIEKYLGLKQVDMISSTLLDYVFPKDHAELFKQFDVPPGSSGRVVHGLGLLADHSAEPIEMDISYASCQAGTREAHRRFFVHMKCVYSQRNSYTASKANADYMLLQCIGYLHLMSTAAPNFLAAVCRPLQPTPIMELKMDGNMFLSRHSMDMRFIYCDPRLSTIFGYEPDEVMGNSMYNYHHPGDLETCSDCHSNLITTGASMSKYYRFLGKSNEWFWLQTRATVVYNASKHPQYIVCMNYIVSEKEGKRYLEEHLNTSEGQHPLTCLVPQSASSHMMPVPNNGTALVDRHSSSELVNNAAILSEPFHSFPRASGDRDMSMMSLASNISEISLGQMESLPHEDKLLAGNHSCGDSPDLSNQPTFYIDTRGDSVAREISGSAPPAGNSPLAAPSPLPTLTTPCSDPLGNLWLSVHAITDPLATPIHASEIYPMEFAEEIEDLSYAHCSKLMRESTEAALRAYGREDDRRTPESQGGVAGQVTEWDACLAALDRQASRLYDAVHRDGFLPAKRSLSSSSLSASATVATPLSQMQAAVRGHNDTLSMMSSSSSSSPVSSRLSGTPTPSPGARDPLKGSSTNSTVEARMSCASLAASEGFDSPSCCSSRTKGSEWSLLPLTYEDDDQIMAQLDDAGEAFSADDLATISDLLLDYPDLIGMPGMDMDEYDCNSASIGGTAEAESHQHLQGHHSPLESPLLPTMTSQEAKLTQLRDRHTPKVSILQQLLTSNSLPSAKSSHPSSAAADVVTPASTLSWTPMSGVQLDSAAHEQEQSSYGFDGTDLDDLC